MCIGTLTGNDVLVPLGGVQAPVAGEGSVALNGRGRHVVYADGCRWVHVTGARWTPVAHHSPLAAHSPS